MVGRFHRPAYTCPFYEIKIASGFPVGYIDVNQDTYIIYVCHIISIFSVAIAVLPVMHIAPAIKATIVNVFFMFIVFKDLLIVLLYMPRAFAPGF